MPTLKFHAAEGTPKLYSVHKPVTTVGKAAGNDLVISGEGVMPNHIQIAFDGRDFVVEELQRKGSMTINGKKKRRARLVHGDRVKLGDAELSFSMFAEGLKKRPKRRDEEMLTQSTALGTHEVAGVRKLFSFSEKLIKIRELDDLLATMLDDVIELSHAQKGFILLLEATLPTDQARQTGGANGDRKWVVRAARNVAKTAIADDGGGISDSIVQQVIASGTPLIVSDAVSDTTFGKSESVVALQLSSVMCAPLVAQGEAIGALYVGNDKVKELFRKL